MTPLRLSLRAARVNAGLTQESLATRIGVSKTTINSWESGKTSPDVKHLRMVCEITGIPMDYIFLPDTLPKVN